MPKVQLFVSSSFDRSIGSNLVYGVFTGAELKITVKFSTKETVLRNLNVKSVLKRWRNYNVKAKIQRFWQSFTEK